MLANQIMSQLHERAGRAPSNFTQSLPAGDSELMQQLTKGTSAQRTATVVEVPRVEAAGAYA